MVSARGHRRAVSRCVGAFLLISFGQFLCDAKILPRRDPLDGALDSTVIAILRQESLEVFRVEEAFLGDVAKGQILLLPGFRLEVEDRSTAIAGRLRTEPIQNNTRILVFLKPAATVPRDWPRYGQWVVAGFGNCYFWSNDPGNLSVLRQMAKQALSLRHSWEAARSLPDKRARTEALWPYLWDHNGSCYKRTEAALQEIGSIAGDYIAARLDSMTYSQKYGLLIDFVKYRSARLHGELILELKRQQQEFDAIIRARGAATYDEIDPPRRNHYYPGRPQDADADKASDIAGVLYSGLTGLGRFRDRRDLPFIREVVAWGEKYKWDALGDAALEAFASMPDKKNLPLIEAIWNLNSSKRFTGRDPRPDAIIRTLNPHRFPEAIPLMAQFVNVPFMQDTARRFLVQMTSIDFGGDEKRWLGWYSSHKRELGVGN